MLAPKMPWLVRFALPRDQVFAFEDLCRRPWWSRLLCAAHVWRQTYRTCRGERPLGRRVSILVANAMVRSLIRGT